MKRCSLLKEVCWNKKYLVIKNLFLKIVFLKGCKKHFKTQHTYVLRSTFSELKTLFLLYYISFKIFVLSPKVNCYYLQFFKHPVEMLSGKKLVFRLKVISAKKNVSAIFLEGNDPNEFFGSCKAKSRKHEPINVFNCHRLNCRDQTLRHNNLFKWDFLITVISSNVNFLVIKFKTESF